MTPFWRRIFDEPDAFPSEFWQLFSQSSLTALGERRRPVCVGMAWRRLITAGATRQQWRSRLEEVNRKVRQFGVAVPEEWRMWDSGRERCMRRSTGSLSPTATTPLTP